MNTYLDRLEHEANQCYRQLISYSLPLPVLFLSLACHHTLVTIHNAYDNALKGFSPIMQKT